MRTWLVASFGVLITLSSSAFGAKPDRVPEPPASVTFPAPTACRLFDIELRTETRGFVKVFANGEIQSTGYERAWVTNLSTGKQIELIVNGRVHIVLPDDGDGDGELVTTGPQIIVFFPGDAGPGNESEARMYYFKGNSHAIIDANFTFFEFAFSGTSTDLCALLS